MCILHSDLLSIWRNQVANAIREETTKNNLHPVCRSWNNCPYQTLPKNTWTFSTHKNFKYPTALEICLPDKHCNIGGENPTKENPACIMCIRHFRDFSKDVDYTDLICEKSKPLMAYLNWFSVLGTAEPFWKDAVFNVLDKVDFYKYKDRIMFYTNTNGTCLNKKTISKFFDYVDNSIISFSLDAATTETFRKIRRLDCYELIIKNIKLFKSMRNDNHKLWIYNNINLLNVHEMVAMVETAADIGVEKLIMLPTHDQSGIVKLGNLTLNNDNVHLFKEAAFKAMKRAEELGVYLQYTKSFDVPTPQLVQIT
jgi:hypothetical protein